MTESAPIVSHTFAQCRSIGHEWRHNGAAERQPWGIALRSRCDDCGTERIKRISPQGALMGNTYAYPDGYSRRGDDRLPLQEWRSLFVVSLLDTPKVPRRKR